MTFLRNRWYAAAWMLEGQAKMMDGEEFWALKPVLLPQDRATAIARRRFDKLVADQQR
jgi:hypothetical protein